MTLGIPAREDYCVREDTTQGDAERQEGERRLDGLPSHAGDGTKSAWC